MTDVSAAPILGGMTHEQPLTDAELDAYADEIRDFVRDGSAIGATALVRRIATEAVEKSAASDLLRALTMLAEAWTHCANNGRGARVPDYVVAAIAKAEGK